MNKLEVLNITMKKQEHGVTVPLSLKINICGGFHTLLIGNNEYTQKAAKVLVMLMLKQEIDDTNKVLIQSSKILEKTSNPKDFKIEVLSGHQDGEVWTEISVRAHSLQDARVIAFILEGCYCPSDVSPKELIPLALKYTR